MIEDPKIELGLGFVLISDFVICKRISFRIFLLASFNFGIDLKDSLL